MLARTILATLLLLMALGQVSDVGGFANALETYRFTPHGGARAFAIGIIVAEAIAGFGLLSHGVRRPAAVLAVGVAVAWSVLAVQAFSRGLVVGNCGCFGVHLTQPLRWWILVEDVEFVALALWAAFSTFAQTRRAHDVVKAPEPLASGAGRGIPLG